MDSPIRIALVGTGFTLHTQLPAFRQVPGATVAWLIGRQEDKTRRLAQQHDIPLHGTSLSTVLESGEVDLVSVTTPVDLHRQQAEACLHAGVAVLCEKPMALNATEAASMCAAATRSGKLALIDHQLRFSPNLVRLRRLVHDGYVGQPLHIELVLRVGGYLDPRRPHNWWSQAERGGGVLGALGSHMIDLLRWIFGEVESVCGVQHTFVPERAVADTVERRHVDSDDHAAFWLRFAHRQAHASVTVSVVAHATDAMRLEIAGDHGRLLVDEETRLWGSRRDPEVPAAQQSTTLESLDAEDPLTAEQRRAVPDSFFGRAFAIFAGHLARGLALEPAVPWHSGPLQEAATFADGAAVQRILDALRRSHDARSWVDLRP